jgi:hypothetical protein
MSRPGKLAGIPLRARWCSTSDAVTFPGGIDLEQVVRSRRVGRFEPPHFERLN